MRPRRRTGLVQGPMWEVGLVEPESFRSEAGHPTLVAWRPLSGFQSL